MALSFKQHDGIFGVIDCGGWNDFRRLTSEFLRVAAGDPPFFEQFVFRGQSCSSWPLMSSFDRRHDSQSFKAIDERYKKVMAAFIKNYAIYGEFDGPGLLTSPEGAEENRYEAIAQHFGLATRLLDWTKSLYVAAFFAFSKVEECTTDMVSVWALHGAQVNMKFSERHISFVDNFYKENRRQLWQMGVFVRNLTDRRNLADLFRHNSRFYDAALDRGPPLLVRFDIPKTALADAIDDLNMMRINSMTLFPGIEGVVRWIESGGYALD